MVTTLKSYYDFAENDYRFFMAAYQQGLIGNTMGAMAQEICEKYLKHIISEYVAPNTKDGNSQKTEALKTHNLNKLAKYLSHQLPELTLDKPSLNMVNGLYFTTRYPGDESITVEKEDIPEYVSAVEVCKKNVDAFLSTHT